MKKWFVLLISLVSVIGVLAACSNDAGTDEGKPKKIILDYAYYSPVSLILKEKGFAEKVLEEDGVEVEFVLSQGSNKALEFLNSKSVDFGSAAGAAALLAKEKGSPIQTVYIASKPEWTALLTKDPAIKTPADLKGKKVAATVGTDPYIFLLRSLKEVGLTAKDVEIVNLQHSDGAAAVIAGEVDAWAGLDPHMAKVELESDVKIFYREINFNSFSTLNVREEFAKQYPEYVDKVLEAYEEARQWTIDHPEETAEILSKEAEMSLDVAKQSLTRNDYNSPIPGEEQKAIIQASGEVLQGEKVISETTDVKKLVDELINADYANRVVKQ